MMTKNQLMTSGLLLAQGSHKGEWRVVVDDDGDIVVTSDDAVVFVILMAEGSTVDDARRELRRVTLGMLATLWNVSPEQMDLN